MQSPGYVILTSDICWARVKQILAMSYYLNVLKLVNNHSNKCRLIECQFYVKKRSFPSIIGL